MPIITPPTHYYPMNTPSNAGYDAVGNQPFTNITGNVFVSGKYNGALYSTASSTGGCQNSSTEWNSWYSYSVNFWYKILSIPSVSNTGSLFFLIGNSTAHVGYFAYFAKADYSPYTGGTNSVKLRAIIDFHGTSTGVLEYNNNIVDNKWHMYTNTIQYSAGPVRVGILYIDGVFQLSRSWSNSGGSGSYSPPAVIGTNTPPGSLGLYPFSQMCEFMLWKGVVLTQSQIASLYNMTTSFSNLGRNSINRTIINPTMPTLPKHIISGTY